VSKKFLERSADVARIDLQVTLFGYSERNWSIEKNGSCIGIRAGTYCRATSNYITDVFKLNS